MTGLTGNATAKTEGELQYYENDQLIGERYRLDVRSLLSHHRSVSALAQGEGKQRSLGVQVWPLFALGDGGGVPVIRSASLVRMQVYAALAYGARGLYYCAPPPP